MSLDWGKWQADVMVDIAQGSFTDAELIPMKFALHKHFHDTPLANEPFPPDIVAERVADGLRLSARVTATSEDGAWEQVMGFFPGLLFHHPNKQVWAGVSVRRIEVRLTQL